MSGPGHAVPDWSLLSKRVAPLAALHDVDPADDTAFVEPLHSRHTKYVRGCDSCENLLDEARALLSEKPWEDQ